MSLEYWIARWSLSSGGAEPVIGRAFARPIGADPVAGDDECDCGAFAFIKHSFAIQRRDAPGLCMDLSPNRGRGECRVPNAPAASRAIVKQAHERRHRRSTGITRHSHTQWF
jgi:hypothetical protein